MYTIQFIQDFEVSASKVFYFFADHERLSEIYPGAFKRIQYGEDPTDTNSKGSIRRIINFPLIMEETITKYIPVSLIEYKITAGEGPVKNHIGIIKVSDIGNGKSRLDYKISFDEKIPLAGFVIKNILEKIIGDGVRKLAQKFASNPNY